MPAPSAPQPRRLAIAPPRTTTTWMAALGGDPVARATAYVAGATVSARELRTHLPGDQARLAGRLDDILAGLAAAERYLSGAVLPPTSTPAVWGEPPIVVGVPAGAHPVPADRGREPVYGFGEALDGAHRYLRQSVVAATRATGNLLQAPAHVAALAHGARAVDHVLVAFGAAVWDFEHPRLTGLRGEDRVELRPAPRAAPAARWAREARVLVLGDRIELTTARGRFTIGGASEPISALLHVAPPSPADIVARYDAAERYAHVPAFDDLGTVHVLDQAGTSVFALAVGDWVAQPGVLLASAPRTGALARSHALAVAPLEAAGFLAAASVLGVPLRRGALHPPMTASLEPRGIADPPAPTEPTQATRLVRPGPHLEAYRGRSAGPERARARRTGRLRRFSADPGPGSPISGVLRVTALTTAPFAALFGRLYGAGNPILVLMLAIVVGSAAEPWLWSAAAWLRDRDGRRMRAVYRPGPTAGRSRAHATRAALLWDGESVGVRSGTGHEAWLPQGGDDGVVALTRLIDAEGPWAVALTDAGGRALVVLPEETWLPGADLAGMTGFADAVGLDLRDGRRDRAPLQQALAEDTLTETSAAAGERSRGPETAGTAFYGVVCALLALLTVGDRGISGWLAVAAALSLVPLGLRTAWTWWNGRVLGPGARKGGHPEG